LFTPETIALLEGGCGLIIGTADATGAPHAGRGWGLDVLDGGRLRLLVDAADETTVANLRAVGRVAVTGADVRTLRSRQVKGRLLGLEPAAGTDRARAARYRDALYTAVEETDGQPRVVLDQLTPAAYLVALVEATEVFDQTPGRGAGSALGPSS
jgi:hypothetical protein